MIEKLQNLAIHKEFDYLLNIAKLLKDNGLLLL